MTRRYYDAVFLGMGFEPLLAGALLAKRGFRVLVLGQGERAPTYEAGDRRWPRRSHTFLATHSPVAKRLLAELALHQLFRRRTTAMDPAFQVVLPKHRFDFALAPVDLQREIEREVPAVKRAALDFVRACERHAADLDGILERDLMWPPESFFERREFARATAHQAFDRDGGGVDPFAEFPEAHTFRTLIGAPVRFAVPMDPGQLVPLATFRLHWAWRHAAKVEGGYGWLHQALIEKIETYSGEVRPRESADRVLTKRGAAVGVRLAGSGETIGCSVVAHGRHIGALLPLLPDRTAFGELFEKLGEPTPRYFRYTLNVLVRAEGVPEGIARDVFYVRDAQAADREHRLRIDVGDRQEDGSRLITIEALLPRRAVEEIPGYVASMRERVIAALAELAPFIGDHILQIDSPHDGRELQDIEGRRVITPDEPWSRGPHTMDTIYGYPVRGIFGVCAFPIRTPIKRLLLCGPHVVPGLGDEGAFLTAWSTARLIARSDRKKDWMRRGLWTKVEI
ncbi:MAG: hypothetical protein AAGE52_40775 [Myxococcota bacterium]